MEVQVTDHKITIYSSTIYYWTAGDPKKQTLIFFHGWPGYLLLQSGLIQELAKYFFTIVLQHPGLGKSDPLPSYNNVFEQNAEVAFEVLEREKKDKDKVIVMGQSFGGAVASAFAYKYPENTKSLIMTDSLMGGANRLDLYSLWVYFWLYGGPTIAKLAVYLPKLIVKLLLWEGMGVKIKTTEDWDKLSRTVNGRILLIESYAKVLHESNKTKVSLIDKKYGDFPIIMLWGDRDGKEFSKYGSCNVDQAEQLAEKMKKYNRNLVFIKVHGGHTILYKEPEYVISKIVESLPIK